MRRVEDGLSDSDKWRIGTDPSVPWPYEDSPAPGACPMCGGRGVVLEQLDRERFAVSVPCDRCRRYCNECKKWVQKEGHSHDQK